jgi:hypothetical protein
VGKVVQLENIFKSFNAIKADEIVFNKKSAGFPALYVNKKSTG